MTECRTAFDYSGYEGSVIFFQFCHILFIPFLIGVKAFEYIALTVQIYISERDACTAMLFRKYNEYDTWGDFYAFVTACTDAAAKASYIFMLAPSI